MAGAIRALRVLGIIRGVLVALPGMMVVLLIMGLLALSDTPAKPPVGLKAEIVSERPPLPPSGSGAGVASESPRCRRSSRAPPWRACYRPRRR
jgi:hypothetical protein